MQKKFTTCKNFFIIGNHKIFTKLGTFNKVIFPKLLLIVCQDFSKKLIEYLSINK
jgi:hypothetical protein